MTTRSWIAIVISAAALMACSKKEPAEGSAPLGPAQPAPAQPTPGQPEKPHTGQDPAHDDGHAEPASSRGGVVAATKTGHIELLGDRTGKLEIWLLDAKKSPRPSDGASVKVRIDGKDVVARPAGDHFEAKTEPLTKGHVTAVVTATIGGETETAELKLHLEGDHAAKPHKH